VTEQPDAQQGPIIHIEPANMAGVYANYAQVGHSPYEFTMDFVRLDFGSQPPQGIVVSRVALSPLMVSQLIDALQENWTKYAEKAMPHEIHDDPQDPTGGTNA